MNYETVIGLEVHVQLLTRSKMFCGCGVDYAGAPPNTHVCPVCLGMPGVLPTINRQAVEYTVMTALALGCTVARDTKFDRKNYPYPDLMKGYQISQYDAPIGSGGRLAIEVDGMTREVGITRVHLEEDVAKLTHLTGADSQACSLVDVNRSGVPLMEIVGEPDLRSPEEARQYLMEMRRILRYLGVSTANMEEGSFRCDANISIRTEDGAKSFPKVEVKNMNSFRAVYRAMTYEAERQRQAVTAGKRLIQETRGWVEAKAKTVSQRSKEYAHDYRYFPEPDLPPLTLDETWVDGIRAGLPELPEARRQRFMAQYGLPAYDTGLLTATGAMAVVFEEYCRENPAIEAKEISNWMLGEVSRIINAYGIEVDRFRGKVSPRQLGELILASHGTINLATAKTVLEAMFQTGRNPGDIIKEQGLGQIGDSAALEAAVAAAIGSNPQAVADYAAGKVTALKFLVGQVMKATRGRADPRLVNELLEKKLKER
ncbi:MAG: Asp-tRNA(Asn)/Glu-tRNA(Gln) amidotransferase subunit GatB [Chloroflexota bacterium]